MGQSERPLFRETAIRRYLRTREKDILPQPIRPPTFLCAWLLICLLLGTLLVAWTTELPIFASGTGIVLANSGNRQIDNLAQPGSHVQALIFLPVNYAQTLHTGIPCLAQLGTSATYLPCTVTRVLPGVWGPDEIRQRYQIVDQSAQVPAQPVLIAEADLGTLPQASHYAGSQVRAQVQVGTRRVLSLLPLQYP